MQFQSLGQKDPLEEEMATHSSILAWGFHGQGSLEGNSPWGLKRELDMTNRLSYLIACYMPDTALTHSSLKSTKQGVGAIIFILQQVRNQRYTDTR